jgi:hypothetical protein
MRRFFSSPNSLFVNGKSATTACSGSFWASKESLVRLEPRAEEIPADLDCREAHDPVTYGRINLGVSERLLPSAAKLVVVSRVGRESHNSIAFSSCRHYTASLSFDTTSDPTIRRNSILSWNRPPALSSYFASSSRSRSA